MPSYVLAGFRKTHRLGAEAAMKYVLFGAASAAVMLYGMSLLYGLFGTLDLQQIGADLATMQLHGPAHITLVLALVGLLTGIGFKIAMVPVHFWCPDVFEGASIDVTTFLSVASKAGGLALLMRVLITLSSRIGRAVSLVARRTAGDWRVHVLLGKSRCVSAEQYQASPGVVERRARRLYVDRNGGVLSAMQMIQSIRRRSACFFISSCMSL